MTMTEPQTQVDAALPARGIHLWIAAGLAAAAAAIVATVVGLTMPAAAAITTLQWVLAATIAVVGAVLALYDFREHRLPDRLVFPLYGATAALLGSLAVISGDWARLGFAALGGAALWAVYFVIGLLGGIGYGDVKLAGILGAWLGWFGFMPLLSGTVLAYLIALPHVIVLIARRRGGRVPFGPYLIIGALIAGIAATL